MKQDISTGAAPKGPNDKASFCPACGCADVTTSTLAGGEASCNVCGWKGRVEDLAVFHFSHEMGSAEEVFRNFFLDVRSLITKSSAQQIGQLLLKWGFIDAPVDRKVFARYLGGIAQGIAKGVFETRQAIEKEKNK